MSGADSPVVAFLATASDGVQVTVRDAWLAIWDNMPWVSRSLLPSSARAAHQIGSFRTSLFLTHALRRRWSLPLLLPLLLPLPLPLPLPVCLCSVTTST